MPANPLISEKVLLEALRDREVPVTPDTIRTYANAVLLAAFDRQVDREFFVDVLNTQAQIQYSLHQLELYAEMCRALTMIDPEHKPELLDQKIEPVIQGFTRQRDRLAEHLELISQCPTLADTVH